MVDKPTLIHLADSASTAVLWLLEELVIDYDIRLFPREHGQAPPALKETHLQGKSPQLLLANGRVITQLSAILLYLLSTYDKECRFHHPDDDIVREEQLVCIGVSDLSTKTVSKLIFHGLTLQSPFYIRPLLNSIRIRINQLVLDPDIAAALDVLESELEDREWFMGGDRPSRADFVLHFYVDVLDQTDYIDLDKYPRLQNWTRRCNGRDAWKRSLERGNGYNLDFPRKH